jgi:hypothetical protein
MRYIISTIVSIGISFGILFGLKYVGFEATSFSLFFILPVGGFIAGAIAGFGYPMAMESKNKKATKLDGIIVFILAISSFVLVHFMYYKMTYLTADMTMNYKFKGDHISEFYLTDSDKTLNFVNYTKFKIESMSISFTRRFNTLFTVSENSVVNYFFFFIDFLGYLLGFMTSYISLSNKKYCETCEKYKKSKDMFKIIEDFEVSLKELMSFFQEGFRGRVNEIKEKHNLGAANLSRTYLMASVDYCEVCFDGELVLKKYEKNEKDKFQEVKNSKKEMKISKEVVRDVVNAA